MSLQEWLRSASLQLQQAGRDAPRLAAKLLACKVLRCSRTTLIVESRRQLDGADQQAMDMLLARRKSGEPLAYILGTREFYGRDFQVSPATLIPRPETEHLVEAALTALPQTEAPVLFADMGTGSGCIAVTLAAERAQWRGIAVDISSAALHIAAQNAQNHNVHDRISFIRATMHAPLFQPDSLDILVSNPPYVSSGEYAQVAAEVRHEPASALMPLSLVRHSPHGLESLEQLINLAKLALKPGGVLLLEHGLSQAHALKMCLLNNMWREVRVIRDLAGLDRITHAQKPVS